MRSRASARSGASWALVVLALAAFLAGAGSFPHTHGGSEPGLYNHEHDLTLLAGLAAGGPLPDIAPSVPLGARGEPLVSAPAPLLPSAASLPALSRAPPAP